MTWWSGGRLRGRSERELGDRYFVMFVCGERVLGRLMIDEF